MKPAMSRPAAIAKAADNTSITTRWFVSDADI